MNDPCRDVGALTFTASHDPACGDAELLRRIGQGDEDAMAAFSGSGCRVARAVGVQSEMELAFAGLHQLCAPVLHLRIDQEIHDDCEGRSVESRSRRSWSAARTRSRCPRRRRGWRRGPRPGPVRPACAAVFHVVGGVQAGGPYRPGQQAGCHRRERSHRVLPEPHGGSPSGQRSSWVKICRKNRNTFKMSRKIDAASSGAEATSVLVRARWKSNRVNPAKMTRPSTE